MGGEDIEMSHISLKVAARLHSTQWPHLTLERVELYYMSQGSLCGSPINRGAVNDMRQDVPSTGWVIQELAMKREPYYRRRNNSDRCLNMCF